MIFTGTSLDMRTDISVRTGKGRHSASIEAANEDYQTYLRPVQREWTSAWTQHGHPHSRFPSRGRTEQRTCASVCLSV